MIDSALKSTPLWNIFNQELKIPQMLAGRIRATGK
jgi:hypothetical protein